jgi:3-deoxy-D-manno-octulosonic-acid transferase
MEQFLLFIYEIGLSALLLFVGPFLLLDRKARAGLSEKLGVIPDALANQLRRLNRPAWFHAVSVGEFAAAWPFIQAFHERFPEKAIVISTTTATGQALAKERAGNLALVVYFPFDLPWIVNKWLDLINPSLVCIMETELWPCFMESCSKRKIAVAMLNGRISPQSFRMHKLICPVSGPLLSKFALIGAQTQAEASRYRSIGGNSLPVSVFGNLKFDGLSTMTSVQAAILQSELNIGDQDLVLVAGSTHDGEETVALDVLDKFAKNPDNQSKVLRLIIAPRHPERFELVAAMIANRGYSVRRHSQGQTFKSKSDVFLLDTIGSLSKFYSVASVAFVGGTIAKVGGHNLAEPYTYGVPVVCGPSLYKTKDTAIVLLERNALRVGEKSEEVEQMLLNLLTDKELRETIGNCGKAWLLENQGAVERALKMVIPLMVAQGDNALLAKPSDKTAKV